MRFVDGMPIEFWREAGVKVGEYLTFTEADRKRLAWRRTKRAMSRFMRLGFVPRFMDIPNVSASRKHYGFFGVCNSTSSRAHRRNVARRAYRGHRALRHSISNETRIMNPYFVQQEAARKEAA